MTIPPFDEHGNLPAGTHQATPDEIMRRLCSSNPTRQRLQEPFPVSKNDRQMTVSTRKLEGLQARLERLALKYPDPDEFSFYSEATHGHVTQLEWELECYRTAQSGDIDALLNIWEREGTLKPNPKSRLNLGDFIALVRVARGLTQTQLAERLDMAQANVARLERSDYHSHTLDTLERVFTVLGIRLTLTKTNLKESA